MKKNAAFSVVGIVPAQNEEKRIGRVVAQLKKLPLKEIVVVANGCDDQTASMARYAGAKVVSFKESLGHDVARAVGTASVPADAYLFTDGDVVCRADELAPFIEALKTGVDVALNDLDSMLDYPSKLHVASISKAFLNYAMGAPELGVNSLTAIPHGLSHKAVEAIGIENLMVPPKALWLAKQAGMKIKAIISVDVVKRNRFKGDVHKSLGHMDSLIIGDHLEAISELIKQLGPRGDYVTDKRSRDLKALQ